MAGLGTRRLVWRRARDVPLQIRCERASDLVFRDDVRASRYVLGLKWPSMLYPQFVAWLGEQIVPSM
jgi:hypothetical protein